MIHHTIVASQIHFQGEKKPPQGKDAGEPKGKGVQFPNASKVLAATKKAKNQEKGYKGQSKISLDEMEKYWKDKKCFKCNKQGHMLLVCPKKNKGMKLQRLLLWNS